MNSQIVQIKDILNVVLKAAELWYFTIQEHDFKKVKSEDFFWVKFSVKL